MAGRKKRLDGLKVLEARLEGVTRHAVQVDPDVAADLLHALEKVRKRLVGLESSLKRRK